jgi:hypothetical protein
VRDAFRRAIAGESLREILAILRHHPRSPQNVPGIHQMLRRRVYLGEIKVSGTWRPGVHPPLVDRATFERAAQALRSRQAGGRKPTGERSADLVLVGFLRCALCGRKCGVTFAPKGERYYVCAARRKPQDYEGRGCAGPYTRAERLEVAAGRDVLERIAGLRELLAEAPEAPAKVEDLAAARTKVEARLQRAVRLAVDGAISTEELRRQRARLDVELGDIARREAEQARTLAGRAPEARGELAVALADLAGTWAKMEPPERRRALHLLAARVDLGEDRALRWTWWTAEEMATAG